MQTWKQKQLLWIIMCICGEINKNIYKKQKTKKSNQKETNINQDWRWPVNVLAEMWFEVFQLSPCTR